jgi:hypothetical protein
LRNRSLPLSWLDTAADTPRALSTAFFDAGLK